MGGFKRPSKQSPHQNKRQKGLAAYSDMDTASCTWPGGQDPSPQSAPNDHHQIPPPHDQGNGGPVQPNIGPYPYYHDASGDSSSSTDNSMNRMPGIKYHTSNNMMNTQPLAAGSNYAHYHLQNGQSHMQSFAPMYPGFKGQQSTSNGNGPMHNNNNGNGIGIGVNGQMPDIHCNDTFDVPSQNGQGNNMIAHQNRMSQPLHDVNPGVPPQMPDTHCNETFNVPSQNGQSNSMIAHQNRMAQPLHGGYHEAAPQYLSPYAHQNAPHPAAPHHPVQNGINIPTHPEFNGVQANTGHLNPTLDAMNNGIGSHHPGSWGSHPFLGQNPLALDNRPGSPQSLNQYTAPGRMGTVGCPVANGTHQTNVEHPNQGVATGSHGGRQTDAVIPPPHGAPPFPHHAAPASDPVYVKKGIPGYQADVNVGHQNSQAPSSNAQAPDRSPGSGAFPHPNPSYGGFNMPPSANVICSGVQVPNSIDARPPPNANPPGFQNGQPHNPVYSDFQPADNHNVEYTRGPYAGQHPNANNPGFQNGAAHNPALGFQPHGISNAAHTGSPYCSQRPNTVTGSNGVTHETNARPPPAQCSASAPAPTTFLNQQAPGHAFDLHLLQDPILGRPPPSNVPIAGAVGTHTYPAMAGYPVPGHPGPANGHVNGAGNGLSPAHAHVKQPHANPRKDSRMAFMVDDGGNRKTGAQKRGQPRKPRAGKGKGGGGKASGPPLLRLLPNGKCAQAPMTPDISPPAIGSGSGCGDVPSDLPDLLPNGRAKASTWIEMLASLPLAPHESNGSAPWVNSSHQQNEAHMYPTMAQGGNAGAPPGPPALQAPTQSTTVPTAVGIPPGVPAIPNHVFDIAPDVNDMWWGFDDVPWLPDPLDDLLKKLHTERNGVHGEKDLLASAWLAHSMPFESRPEVLANRAAAIMQQDQPGTVRMSDIQPDTDARFRKKMKRIHHEIFPGLPGQTQWLLGSSLAHPGAANFRLETRPGGSGGKQRPGGGGKMTVGNPEVPPPKDVSNTART
ncbi:hypothetical protein GX50_07641 [[Emmonsia] crescens]|uniref:Uncharacterized protein n=1 Tax=[Emmonsia] crescens TaxID=73230 RepID=A0A2B7Z9V7_9EURO|nr:hypothetical protein GX50_07641 [Emmonsia crescens]